MTTIRQRYDVALHLVCIIYGHWHRLSSYGNIIMSQIIFFIILFTEHLPQIILSNSVAFEYFTVFFCDPTSITRFRPKKCSFLNDIQNYNNHKASDDYKAQVTANHRAPRSIRSRDTPPVYSLEAASTAHEHPARMRSLCPASATWSNCCLPLVSLWWTKRASTSGSADLMSAVWWANPAFTQQV